MGGHDDHHEISFGTYLKVLLTLLVLTLVTVWISGVNLHPFNMMVAMAIATVKVVLVLGYFMHLKYDSNLNRAMFVAGVFFLLVMFVFTYGDIVTRILQKSTL